MVWPFRRKAHRGGPHTRGAAYESQDPDYVARPQIEKSIIDALAQSQNLMIYGPSRQGKTLLLTRLLGPADSIIIECRPGFKRTQIYRVALSALGYSLLVKKRRRGKAKTTVGFGIATMGAGASAEGEVEQTMQSINVDLRNPSEVAHLIARMKRLPRIVLNNFHLLDNATKANLLFDLTFLAERPGIRIIIVGVWLNEDYLEEIEPAISGKYRAVFVPSWSDAELRKATAQWAARSKSADAVTPRLDEFVALAAGDISLFRTLVERAINTGTSAPDRTSATPTVVPIQAMVLARFRRGLSGKLKAIFAERDIYLTYSYLQHTIDFVTNPRFQQIPNARESDYIRTAINPNTNRRYSDGRQVLLDRDGNPQYIEVMRYYVDKRQTEFMSFLLRSLHGAVQQSSSEIGLTGLAQEFGEQFVPEPIGLDRAALKAVFANVDEAQRKAFVVPHLLAVHSESDAIEIMDRRLFLFLSSVALDDLDELLDGVQPISLPKARARNHVSVRMTREERTKFEKIVELVPIPDEPGEDVSIGTEQVGGVDMG